MRWEPSQEGKRRNQKWQETYEMRDRKCCVGHSTAIGERLNRRTILKSFLSYTKRMIQNFLAFRDSPIITLRRSPNSSHRVCRGGGGHGGDGRPRHGVGWGLGDVPHAAGGGSRCRGHGRVGRRLRDKAWWDHEDIIHTNIFFLYALFSCICTVIFCLFLKDLVGDENVHKKWYAHLYRSQYFLVLTDSKILHLFWCA